MYRIIFGECDVELFQAEHQLGFVFLLHLHPHNSLMGLKIYLCSFIVLAVEYHSMSITVICIRLQMLLMQAEHLLLRIFFLIPLFRLFIP